MEDLIQQYKETLKVIRRERETEENPSARQTLSEMIRDLEYAIKWMTTGRQPGNTRGIERRAAYQRERPTDPIHFQRYAYKEAFQQPECTLSDWDMWRVEDALSSLTKLEREVYMMKVGQGFSMEKVASLLGLTKSSVQTMLGRSQKKMTKQKETSLFCVR
ncbi:sigma factor-like helix-turn-helix DNA-binding protein [Salinithrix halophila]|uniref:Sigma factor-like helix-turn-helix DNA-binding protein n=1 Tax=Salinithrix halophila TaxID=1485204 RepID=A0ABV8JA91_9BACL